MARTGQEGPEMESVAVYLQGVAKYLLGKFYGADGPPWGTSLSRLEDLVFSVQQSLAREFFTLALNLQAQQSSLAPDSLLRCPSCRLEISCSDSQARSLISRVGVAAWREPAAYCSVCRRSYFPQSRSLGIDQTGLAPSVVRKVISCGSRCRSFAETSDLLLELSGLDIDPKAVERLIHLVGQERVDERDRRTACFLALPLAEKFTTPAGVAAPDLAVVMVDGGRLQIRKPPGLKSQADAEPCKPSAGPCASSDEDAEKPEDQDQQKKDGHWREDKVALLLPMSSETFTCDPCPDIPPGFLVRARMAKLVRELGKKVPNRGEPSEPEEEAEEQDKVLQEKSAYVPPTPGCRKVLASRLVWPEFAVVVASEAWSLGFQGAKRKAFVGDGSDNNWEVHRRFFGSFTCVLDFIHALSYVHAAAQADRSAVQGFKVYRRWITWLWAGQVTKVIEELTLSQKEIGEVKDEDGESSPRRVVGDSLRYLSNHQDMMKYDEYRKAGLPITSSLMESTVKQINHRVKGTEKFWTEEGAEAILQLRADQISEDDQMDQFYRRRETEASGQRRYRRSKDSAATRQQPRQKQKSRVRASSA